MIISNILAIVFSVTLSAIISFFWVMAIDNMKKKYPDYKGEDFLNDFKHIKDDDKKEEDTLSI